MDVVCSDFQLFSKSFPLAADVYSAFNVTRTDNDWLTKSIYNHKCVCKVICPFNPFCAIPFDCDESNLYIGRVLYCKVTLALCLLMK